MIYDDLNIDEEKTEGWNPEQLTCQVSGLVPDELSCCILFKK